MPIRVEGARENNLKNISALFSDGLTVVTGVSGSGKSSLVFDTLHREGRNRFNEAFGTTPGEPEPVAVSSVDGLGPVVSLEQNTLNRHPGSTLATASGLHPFLRLLFARYGRSRCPQCGADHDKTDKAVLAQRLFALSRESSLILGIPLLTAAAGSHRTLLGMLRKEFPPGSLYLDGILTSADFPWDEGFVPYEKPHDIEIRHWLLSPETDFAAVSSNLDEALTFGSSVIKAYRDQPEGQSTPPLMFSLSRTCPVCGAAVPEMQPRLFNLKCETCRGKGCDECHGTGLHRAAAAVSWDGWGFGEILARTGEEALEIFRKSPVLSNRLREEIVKRLDALCGSGLGYAALERPVPTLSRGEAQRLKLSVSLTSRLEDMVHILDEPTIGQHPWNVKRIIPRFRALPGPVIFVEHDRTAARMADWAVDIGPGAGPDGGRVLYNGDYGGLLETDSPTGVAFRPGTGFDGVSEKTETKPQERDTLSFLGCRARNLKDADVHLYTGELTVITGVSGSGKSTLFEEVILKSLKEKKPRGCEEIVSKGMLPAAVLVDQKPIGKNPRSNPGTYTKLSDVLRDLFARKTGEPAGLFSFNTERGRCPDCSGMGAKEVKMHYLPSFWETCESCGGKRFNDAALAAPLKLEDRSVAIDEIHDMPFAALRPLLASMEDWPGREKALAIIDALLVTGLGYLSAGQPSPTLSGGEAQRIKLARYLSRRRLKGTLFLLDEPSTGLHPADIGGLLKVFRHLIGAGASVVIIEHNSDIIRNADRVIDLGPYSGPEGGQIVYQGDVKGLLAYEESLTGAALREEEVETGGEDESPSFRSSSAITIEGARSNNLRSLSLEIPKGRLTVLAGVSGSGKSSLLHNVLEREARRRYLESLSLYERQGIRESAEPEVKSLSGLGVTARVSPGRRLFNPRSTVGSQTEIIRHLAVMTALTGKIPPGTAGREIRLEPRFFLPGSYGSACPDCNGLGTRRIPNPEKLIIHPEKPLCAGAMFSPGFFPQGYLGKPFNGGYYEIQALGKSYGFHPHETPWEEMSEEARQAFLFGTDRILDVYNENRKGQVSHRRQGYEGFYGRWVGEWDLGGTYTDIRECPVCNGSGFAAPFRSVTLAGRTHRELYTMPLEELREILENLSPGREAQEAYTVIKRRLGFLCRVGLGYIALNRQTATLSAGEAMRIRLSSLLGSRLTNLTVLLDEPTRGMHPSEVDGLMEALFELRDGGNTVVMVEHDPECLARADHLIELGPGGGSRGGRIVCQGDPRTLVCPDSPTLSLLRRQMETIADKTRSSARTPRGFMTLTEARGNNLKVDRLSLPLGVLTGICGVSGSGKSSLIFDTIGRICAPRKYTTSMAHEILEPGEHRSLEGRPESAYILDQSVKGLRSPGDYLGITARLEGLFARAAERDREDFKKRCPHCRGRGVIREDMEFLPAIETSCEACGGTGIPPDLHDTELLGHSFPAILALTLEELHGLFTQNRGENPAEKKASLEETLEKACRFGLGYLICRQPGIALSGGEAQRLKIIKEILNRRKPKGETLYLLDEPTVGLHMADTERLILALEELVDQGHTVMVIEHNPDLLALCDHLIELGPGGGPRGGRIVFEGAPEKMTGSPTAPYVLSRLGGAS